MSERSCPKQGLGRSAAHLRWIRSLPCSIAGCNGASVAAHVRRNTGGGMGMKPPDAYTVPLCHSHHMAQHRGDRAFEQRHGIDLLALSVALAARSPALTTDA